MSNQITEKIWVGNSQDSLFAKQEDFDAILNVAIDLDINTTFKYRHKVGLIDGPGNDRSMFIAAVMCLHGLHQKSSNKRILVHCHAGMSRSVMVVSVYRHAFLGEDFEVALADTMKKRGVEFHRGALKDLALECIEYFKI